MEDIDRVRRSNPFYEISEILQVLLLRVTLRWSLWMDMFIEVFELLCFEMRDRVFR